MIGLGATQVDKMSLWQLTAQSEAFADAHTPKDKRGMSDAEIDEIAKRLEG